MPFKKDNKLGFTPKEDLPLDSIPLSLKLRKDVRSKVMSIPGWQGQIRDAIEDWVNTKLGDNEQL